MQNQFRYLPQSKRKKILLISDDIRLPSGVGNVGKELILHTAQHFNWINLGAAINHPDLGKKFDLSADTNTHTGLSDALVYVIPNNGYGDPSLIRKLIQSEKPDAILLITDPRYFIWLFQIENEIRKEIPIIYLNIWDDYPAPYYNRAFYESCDALLAISKQTKLINELVLEEKTKNKVIKYVPHGMNKNFFYPIKKGHGEYDELLKFKKTIFGNNNPNFIIFFNSRNIRRKSIPDLLLAYRIFLDNLSQDQIKNVALVLHTEIISDAGTDLMAVKDLLFGHLENPPIYFSQEKISANQLNYFYNLADVTALLSSNEGWGLSLTESLLTGTPIIANVTGGMQDQMRFEDNNGNWFEPTAEIPSNHRGTYKKCGNWAFPVFPNNRSIVGSPQTPYIFDDRCAPEDAAEQIMKVYQLSPEQREKFGMEGYEWAMGREAGFTSEIMGERAIEALDELFENWKPREHFEFIKIEKPKVNKLNHNLIY